MKGSIFYPLTLAVSGPLCDRVRDGGHNTSLNGGLVGGGGESHTKINSDALSLMSPSSGHFIYSCHFIQDSEKYLLMVCHVVAFSVMHTLWCAGNIGTDVNSYLRMHKWRVAGGRTGWEICGFGSGGFFCLRVRAGPRTLLCIELDRKLKAGENTAPNHHLRL